MSWTDFEVYFNVNGVTKEDVKFKIFNAKLPWETMKQFGKEYPNGGGNLGSLRIF